VRSATLRRLDYSLFPLNDTATTQIYTLSLHDALPIYAADGAESAVFRQPPRHRRRRRRGGACDAARHGSDDAVGPRADDVRLRALDPAIRGRVARDRRGAAGPRARRARPDRRDVIQAAGCRFERVPGPPSASAAGESDLLLREPEP